MRIEKSTPEIEGKWLWGPVARKIARVNECTVALAIFAVDDASTGRRIMIDVGAHHGSSLGRFASQGWTVIAFEPDMANRERLLSTLEVDWVVTVDARALGNHADTDVSFFRSDVSTGISGLTAFHETHVFAHMVEVTTLETALVEYGITHVDFLKIDTEGHDLKVMQGYPWQCDLPTVIVCEFDDVKVETGSATRQAELLYQLGYNLFVSEWHPVVQYGIPHDFRGIWAYESDDQITSENWGNLIAVRPHLVNAVGPAVRSAIQMLT